MGVITISNDRLRLAVLPHLGAGIADFSILGPGKFHHALMRRAAPDETNPSALGSFLLAPWCNRIAGAVFTFQGKKFALKASGSDGSAMHGDVRARPWRILDRSPNSARLEFDTTADGVRDVNWPWPFKSEVRYELSATGLTIDLSVTNLGDTAMPAGCGHHPYFARKLWSDRDEVQLRAAVTGRYPLSKAIPTGPHAADRLCQRMATLAAFPAESLDDVFAAGTATAGACAELHWPASGVTLSMTSSKEFGHLVLYSPPVDAARPAAGFLPFVAVEPVSQVNNALNVSGNVGTVVLAPGGTLSTTFTLGVKID